MKLAYEYFGDDDDYVTIPQAAAIDATYTNSSKEYAPLLETEDGTVVSVQPVMKKQ